MQKIELQTLKQLFPLNALMPKSLRELRDKCDLMQAPAGSYLFRQGDDLEHYIYLLSGTVSLQKEGDFVETVEGGADISLFALSHKHPRAVSAKADEGVSYLKIDCALVNTLLVRSRIGHEEGQHDDSLTNWLENLLQHRFFPKLPTASIEGMVPCLKEIPLKKGDVVTSQGDRDAAYFIVKQGRCEVIHTLADDSKRIKIGEAGIGEGFGELGVLAGGVRHATVLMMTDGVVMRLERDDFLRWIRDPLLRKVDAKQVKALLEEGALALDARASTRFAEDALEGSISISLESLRRQVSELDAARTHFIYCDSGVESASIAFLLGERNFIVYLFDGGLQDSSIVALLDEVKVPARVEPAPVSEAAPEEQEGDGSFAALEEVSSCEVKESSENYPSPTPVVEAVQEEELIPPSVTVAVSEQDNLPHPSSLVAEIRAELKQEQEASHAEWARELQTALYSEMEKVRQGMGVARKELSADLRALQEQNQKLQEELDSARNNESKALALQLASEKRQATMQQRFTEVDGRRGSVQEEVGKELKALRAEWESARRLGESRDTIQEDLLNSLKVQNSALQEELDQLRKDQRELLALQSAEQQQRVDLQTQRDKVREERDVLQDELRDAHARAKKERSDWEARNERLDERKGVLEDEVEKKQKELEALQSQLFYAQAQPSESGAKITALEQEYEQAQQKIEIFQKEEKKAQATLLALQTEVDEFRQQISAFEEVQKQSQLETDNTKQQAREEVDALRERWSQAEHALAEHQEQHVSLRSRTNEELESLRAKLVQAALALEKNNWEAEAAARQSAEERAGMHTRLVKAEQDATHSHEQQERSEAKLHQENDRLHTEMVGLGERLAEAQASRQKAIETHAQAEQILQELRGHLSASENQLKFELKQAQKAEALANTSLSTREEELAKNKEHLRRQEVELSLVQADFEEIKQAEALVQNSNEEALRLREESKALGRQLQQEQQRFSAERQHWQEQQESLKTKHETQLQEHLAERHTVAQQMAQVVAEKEASALKITAMQEQEKSRIQAAHKGMASQHEEQLQERLAQHHALAQQMAQIVREKDEAIRTVAALRAQEQEASVMSDQASTSQEGEDTEALQGKLDEALAKAKRNADLYEGAQAAQKKSERDVRRFREEVEKERATADSQVSTLASVQKPGFPGWLGVILGVAALFILLEGASLLFSGNELFSQIFGPYLHDGK